MAVIERGTQPLVSVGVPVFNGQNGLSRCLNALLEQDYQNTEIIISDNGSTDATPTIGRSYAGRDPRVKYHRSDINRGSIWNFNRVFELASGKYFMWAAHDDDREPSFVSACVAQLEIHPDAVLCQAHTAVHIEGHPDVVYIAHLDSYRDVTGLVERYRETLKRFPATAIYGIYRASALRQTHLFQPVIGTDVALMQEVSIHGRFVQVPELLFNYRARSNWNTIHQDAHTFLGVRAKPWWYVPFVALFLDHARRVKHARIDAGAKLRLCGVLVVHHVREAALKLLLKGTGLLCPGRWKVPIAEAIYWRWMHSPNVTVLQAGLFRERVVKPQVGWWR